MIRNLKALGLGLVAFLAIGGGVAWVAVANNPAQLEAEAGTVRVDWNQTNEWSFKWKKHTVSCETVGLEGEGSNEATTISNVTATFGKCKEPVPKNPATVNMNGCIFTFHLTGDVSVPEDRWTAITDLSCAEKKEMTITIYSDAGHTSQMCTYDIPPQTGKTKIELTNKMAGSKVNGVETPKDFLIAHVLLELKTDVTGGFLTCGSTDEVGLLEGEAELIGTDSEKNQTGITVRTP